MTTTTTTTAGNHQTVTLDEGQSLNVLPDSAGTGTAYLLDNSLGLGNSSQSWALAAGVPLQVGPFSGTRRVRIVCATGSIQASTLPAVLNLPQIVVASSAPVDADGRPDSTLYVRPGSSIYAKAGGTYVATGGGSGSSTVTLSGSRSLALSDNGATLVYSGSSNITLTIPSGLGAGFACTVVQAGTGKVSMAAGSGVTFANLGSTAGGNTFITAVATAADTFAFQNATPAGPVTALLAGIPFILLSSWTFGTNGALSAITLPSASITAAYCYFPANAIATGVPAGWYYTTFSSVSAGTVYNNTYTTGTPVIPASPTAFSTTAGSVTAQVTSAVQAQNVTLPGGSLGKNGRVRAYALFQSNNSANSKVAAMSIGGGQITTFTLSSSNIMSEAAHTTQNMGVQNAQISRAATYNSLTGTPNFSTVDTAADQVLAVNLTLATAATGDYIISYAVEFTAEYGA